MTGSKTTTEKRLKAAEAVIKELVYSHHHCLSAMERQYDQALEMAQHYLKDFGDHNHVASECPWRRNA